MRELFEEVRIENRDITRELINKRIMLFSPYLGLMVMITRSGEFEMTTQPIEGMGKDPISWLQYGMVVGDPMGNVRQSECVLYDIENDMKRYLVSPDESQLVKVTCNLDEADRYSIISIADTGLANLVYILSHKNMRLLSVDTSNNLDPEGATYAIYANKIPTEGDESCQFMLFECDFEEDMMQAYRDRVLGNHDSEPHPEDTCPEIDYDFCSNEETKERMVDVTKLFNGRRVFIYSEAAKKCATAMLHMDYAPLCCCTDHREAWEIYTVEVDNEGRASFKAFNGLYLTVDFDENSAYPPINARGPKSDAWEKFRIYKIDGGGYAIKAVINDKWVTCRIDWDNNPLYATCDSVDWWETFDIQIHN